MPKIVDEAERRETFLTASLHVIAWEGFGALTMRRVADAANCTTGALTHYFTDKEALLIATLQAAHTKTANRMAEVAQAELSDFLRLRAILLESLPLDDIRLREWKVWLAFWSASSSQPNLAKENAERYAEWRRLIERLLTPFSPNVSSDAETLIALVDGLGLGLVRHCGTTVQLAERRAACQNILDRYLNDQWGVEA